MHRVKLAVAVVCVMAVSPSSVWAWRAGPPPGRTGSPDSLGATCTQCHGATPGSGSVEILGVPGSYSPGAIYDLTVRVSDPVQAGGGFQISVEDVIGAHIGTLSVTDAVNTKLNETDPNFLNHTSTGVDNAVAGWVGAGNSASYNLRWQAPASDAGPVTFWVAGNAINNNLSSTGDIIYLTNQTISMALPVPAASTWGLVVMSMLILTAGTIAVMRRRQPA